jgi:hypothetical protein
VTCVTSLRAHRFRALTSSVLEGLAVGAVLAGRGAPPWSRSRVRTATAAGALMAVDQVSAELPTVLREVRRTGEVPPVPAHERRAVVRAGIRGVGLGLLVRALEGPVIEALTRRGVPHPHRWLGLAAGSSHAAVVAPVYWRLGGERAAAETERDAAVDAELQVMAAGG